MAIVVQKFGGSSVADSESIKRVAKRVGAAFDQGNQVVVVVSAMGDTTDHLIDLAKQVTKNPPKREMDMLLSTGEQQSMALLAMALQHIGYPSVSLTGQQAGIHTDMVYAKSKILSIDTSRLEKELKQNHIVIVAGFQGVTQDNEITTLGRGGSDTSAVALAASLGADVCEIFTDVEGVYTTDPRLVPKARKLTSITYDEMLELASLGAAVLHPRSVEVAKQFNVKIHVRSSFNENEGTIVQEVESVDKILEKDMVVQGVAYDLNTAKVTVFDIPDQPGSASKLFGALAEEKINVDMIIQSQQREGVTDISFTVTRDDVERANEIIGQVTKEIGAGDFSFDSGVAKISIVGAGMITNPGVAARMFKTLADQSINIEMISTSEIKVSCVIRAELAKKAVISLHDAFELEHE
ncbi:aspartate kinase [Dehalobacterium formicoaceticum]|uniref:Aspartokinase n=1 Tax=Dehalobacterium formicoaceticum TaxID=51515 RepID=A0ABT1Y717_9FIRM|nr:aspartate kinase [Dehalobacterium formicoaceticum]MCR6545890.1 aspartate kinase [Dehalobacterium formicoaceticum]